MENWVLVTLLTSAVLSIVGIATVGFTLGYLHGSSPNDDDVQGQVPREKKPNIVFILLDDLGYNDVSWNNPAVLTPHMETLARSGVILNRNYVHTLCSPSRGELLTGKYAHRLGLQHDVIGRSNRAYLPLGEKLLSERLRDLGYSTHLIGKWHLGYCRLDYLPTRRGFDSFYGTLTGNVDNYKKCAGSPAGNNVAMDWYDQESLDYSHQEIHVTDLLRDRALSIIQQQEEKPFFMFLSFLAPHIPIQAPKKYMDLYDNITDEWRREYLGMITQVDEAVGKVVAMLKAKGLFNNTIIAMTADNGAFVGPGSNFPFRGSKSSLFEGGTRVPGFISGPPSIIKKYGYISNERLHITDWVPTFVSMAQGKIDPVADLDGIDQSSMLSTGSKSKRREIVYQVDAHSNISFYGYAAISYDNYKLIVGPSGSGEGWEQEGTAGVLISKNESSQAPRNRFKADLPPGHVCSGSVGWPFNLPFMRAARQYANSISQNRRLLFDVEADPEERIDLSTRMPLKVQELERRLERHKAQEIPPPDSAFYSKAKTQRDNAWVTGWC